MTASSSSPGHSRTSGYCLSSPATVSAPPDLRPSLPTAGRTNFSSLSLYLLALGVDLVLLMIEILVIAVDFGLKISIYVYILLNHAEKKNIVVRELDSCVAFSVFRGQNFRFCSFIFVLLWI